MFLREPLDQIAAMLPHAFDQVGCHADVQRAVSLTGEEVNAGLYQSDGDGTGSQPEPALVCLSRGL
jgi:hypothetical protein